MHNDGRNHIISEGLFNYILVSPNFLKKFYNYRLVLTKERNGTNNVYFISEFKVGKKYLNEYSSNLLDLFSVFNEFCNSRVYCTLCNSPFHSKVSSERFAAFKKIIILIQMYVWSHLNLFHL